MKKIIYITLLLLCCCFGIQAQDAVPGADVQHRVRVGGHGAGLVDGDDHVVFRVDDGGGGRRGL